MYIQSKPSQLNTLTILILAMSKILLVEDSNMQAKLLRAFLMNHYTTINRANTADDAVECLLDSTHDMVIMDLNLEAGNGIEATERINSLGIDVPVIISTVHVGDDIKRQTIQAGADAYLTKPYSKTELIQTIESLTSNGNT